MAKIFTRSVIACNIYLFALGTLYIPPCICHVLVQRTCPNPLMLHQVKCPHHSKPIPMPCICQ